jgi:hypothetical protein
MATQLLSQIIFAAILLYFCTLTPIQRESEHSTQRSVQFCHDPPALLHTCAKVIYTHFAVWYASAVGWEASEKIGKGHDREVKQSLTPVTHLSQTAAPRSEIGKPGAVLAQEENLSTTGWLHNIREQVGKNERS